MRDRISIMLDSMITTVNEGLSYDGIVSMPDTGLEDFGRRPGIAGWLDDAVEAFYTAKATVSRVMNKLRYRIWRANHPTDAQSSRPGSQYNRYSVADSKFGDEGKPAVQPTDPILILPRGTAPRSQQPSLHPSAAPRESVTEASQAALTDTESSEEAMVRTQDSRGDLGSGERLSGEPPSHGTQFSASAFLVPWEFPDS